MLTRTAIIVTALLCTTGSALAARTMVSAHLLRITGVIPAQQGTDDRLIAERAFHDIQSGDFKSARKLLRAGVQQFPKDVELWNLLGIAETELNDPDLAQGAFERGLRLDPQSISLHENLGLLFYRRGDYETASKSLSQAVALGSSNPGVRFSLAAAKLRTGQENEALAELRALEGPLANRNEYWEERGRAELVLHPETASASFDRALELAPDSSTALNGAAQAAEMQGFDEKALALLIRARSSHPDDVPTLLHFGAVCLRRDLAPDALPALERARRLQPANNSALYLLARAHIAIQNWQQAYDFFWEFTKRVPNYAPAYYAMGWLDVKLNRAEDARKELEHCLSLAPDLADARYELAEVDFDNGQVQEAQKLLNIVLQQNPNHPKANMSMGDLMMRRGNLDRAQDFLERAVRQEPDLAEAHYKLSVLFFRKHDIEKAEREKATAAKLSAEASRASKIQLRLILPETLDTDLQKK
jgi:tetratricopeptide (TPR) repeat protein